VAATDAGPKSAPRAVPDAHRVDGGLRRGVRPKRPATLGDRLNEAMRLRVQTTHDAARALDATTAEVLAWSADEKLPDRKHLPTLQEYLGVDERELRALVLRGQMRLAQARIRD
jgi:hypothetical protein